MRFGKIELLKWEDIANYDEDKSPSSTVLRCPVNGIYVGWLDDDGWRNVENPDHLSEPMKPQPIYYLGQ